MALLALLGVCYNVVFYRENVVSSTSSSYSVPTSDFFHGYRYKERILSRESSDIPFLLEESLVE